MSQHHKPMGHIQAFTCRYFVHSGTSRNGSVAQKEDHISPERKREETHKNSFFQGLIRPPHCGSRRHPVHACAAPFAARIRSFCGVAFGFILAIFLSPNACLPKLNRMASATMRPRTRRVEFFTPIITCFAIDLRHALHWHFLEALQLAIGCRHTQLLGHL